MKFKRITVFSFFSFLILFSPIHSQVTSEKSTFPKKKTVGVVLSGGGAKGMAHVGILKALDSLRVKVNYIGGTSMGSIVAALYSCGYSGAEIEHRFSVMDWNELFNDEIPLRDISIIEKEDYGRFLAQVAFRKRKVDLPSGLIKGRHLFDEFVKLTFPFVSVKNFDSLPVTLRINAVNLENGNNVVFTRGFLPSAMRASMAIPSAFYPVSLDSGYFVDGGILRNTLIPEIKAFHPDYTIVSFTGNKLANRTELNSITNILGHVLFLSGSKDFEDNVEKANVIVQPKISGKDGTSFKRALRIMQSGIDATTTKMGDLTMLANDSLISKKETAPWHDDKAILEELFEIDTITFINLDGTDKRFFESQTQLQTGKLICLHDFFHAIDEAYATLQHEYIYYEFEYKGLNTKGQKKLKIKFRVDEAASSVMRLGLHFNSNQGAGLTLNFLTRNFLIKRSRMVLEADASLYFKARFTYQFYITKHYHTLFGIQMQYEQDDNTIYRNSIATDLNNVITPRFYGWMQQRITNKFSFNGGYEFEKKFIKPRINKDSIDAIRNSTSYTHSILTYLDYNSLNRMGLPTSGIKLRASYKYVFSSGLNQQSATALSPEITNSLVRNFDPYQKASVDFESYTPLNKIVTFISTVNAGFIFSRMYQESDNFYLGSIEKDRIRSVPFYGYRSLELIAKNFVAVGIGLQTRIVKELYFKPYFNIAALNSGSSQQWMEHALDSNDSVVSHASGLGLSLSYLIPKVGPVSITYHSSLNRSISFVYISLGFNLPVQ